MLILVLFLQLFSKNETEEFGEQEILHSTTLISQDNKSVIWISFYTYIMCKMEATSDEEDYSWMNNTDRKKKTIEVFIAVNVFFLILIPYEQMLHENNSLYFFCCFIRSTFDEKKSDTLQTFALLCRKKKKYTNDH